MLNGTVGSSVVSSPIAGDDAGPVFSHIVYVELNAEKAYGLRLPWRREELDRQPER